MTRIQVLPDLSVAEILSQLKQGETILLEDRPGHAVAALTSPDEAIADEAERKFGVRPKKIMNGRPVFSPEETRNPAFKSNLPEEPPEVEARWRKMWDDGKAASNSNSTQ